MRVFEITFPGTFLDYPHGDWRSRIHRMLHLLETQFTDAVVALNLFEREQARVLDDLQAIGQEAVSDEEEELRQTLEQEFRNELGDQLFFQTYPAILHAIELEMRRRQWKSGEMPQKYQSRLPFIYAHAYVYALDSFQKILERLVQEPGIPPAVPEALEKFKAAFPVLRAIRDSAHHIEDRGRGVDRRGKPLDLKPLNGGIVHAPAGGVLLLSNLRGNNLGYTLEDGSHGEIAVGYENTALVAAIFQRVIDAFRWRGVPRQIPC